MNTVFKQSGRHGGGSFGGSLDKFSFWSPRGRWRMRRSAAVTPSLKGLKEWGTWVKEPLCHKHWGKWCISSSEYRPFLSSVCIFFPVNDLVRSTLTGIIEIKLLPAFGLYSQNALGARKASGSQQHQHLGLAWIRAELACVKKAGAQLGNRLSVTHGMGSLLL